MAPPRSVVDAFALRGEPVVLTGGMAPVYRFGDVVAKQVGDPVEASYIAEVMARVATDERRVRVARPVATRDGAWITEGWAAWALVEGHQPSGPQPWSSALDAADALHDALRAEPRPSFLGARTHRWAVADRVAWGEQQVELDPRIAGECARLWPLTGAATGGPAQLLHGDLCGNLLFHPGLPPAVIDFSPTWRPPGFARAVYVVDALGWHHGDGELVRLALADEATRTVLARAGIFRLVALDGRVRDLGLDLEPLLPEYRALIDRLVEVLGTA